MERSVTVVTGGSGALGSEVVKTLLEHGHGVAGIERRKSPEDGLRRGALLGVPIDTASIEEFAAALDLVARELGPVTGAVLAAGAWQGGARFFEPTADAHWAAMMGANLETARVALRALLPAMTAKKRGSIVLIGSRSAVRPWESAGSAAYAASKAAVLALAQSVAAEALDHGVRVNVVLPSTIDTAANRAAMPGADTSRWVSPASLAGVIEFLLSDAARDISGAAIPVYGRAGACKRAALTSISRS